MELYHLDLSITIPTTQPLQVPSLDYILVAPFWDDIDTRKVVQYHMKHFSPGTIWSK